MMNCSYSSFVEHVFMYSCFQLWVQILCIHQSNLVCAADVCLREVALHLRPGQEEALLPSAATLPGQQTGSGLLPEPDDQSHLQTVPEETVFEERWLWVTCFCPTQRLCFPPPLVLHTQGSEVNEADWDPSSSAPSCLARTPSRLSVGGLLAGQRIHWTQRLSDHLIKASAAEWEGITVTLFQCASPPAPEWLCSTVCARRPSPRATSQWTEERSSPAPGGGRRSPSPQVPLNIIK